MRRKKLVGAVDEHAAKLEGLRGKAQCAIAVAHHLRPHVVERVGQKRQGAYVLDRILCRAAGDDVDKPFGLEPRPEQLRRPADDLTQLLLAQRRHVDVLARLE